MTAVLDQREVQAFIDDHFGDRAGAVTRLAGGAWSQAYALTVDGRQVVVRFGAHGADYRKDQVAAKWSSAALPIPGFIEFGETEGGFFAVSERLHGDALDKLDSQRMTTVFPSLFRTMDAIRAIDISHTKGYGMWGPDGRGPQDSWQDALLQTFAGDQPNSRTSGWRAALEHSPGGARDFDTGLKVLERLVARMPDERQVIHHDLLYDNVLVEGESISGVLDWGNSTYGDWLYDAAWLLYCQPRYTAWPDGDLAGELRRHWAASGSLPDNLDARLLCYQIHIGLGAQAGNAKKKHWDELQLNTIQTMKLVEAARGIL